MPHKFLNANTAEFSANGTGIPEVDFDIGESYAGQIRIYNDTTDKSNLFFWFFPTINQTAEKEIIIWLNGGPGCSSLMGLMQEHGPFLWQPGVLKPVSNPWSWHTLTNIVYIDQPVATGYSTGSLTINSSEDAAQQFLSWWKNFVDTFSLQGYKIYMAGESYAGMFAPYIASAMIDSACETYYNISGMFIIDPWIAPLELHTLPDIQFTEYWPGLFPFNESFRAHLQSVDEYCGKSKLISKYLAYPPSGHIPFSIYPGKDTSFDVETCYSTVMEIFEAAIAINPCFDIYHASQTCPFVYDPYGGPSVDDDNPPDQDELIYFDRPDVKRALHVPEAIEFVPCSPGVHFANPTNTDESESSSYKAVPRVIDHTKRVIIAHGALDSILFANGTLMAIQNMTWGGVQGFQHRPDRPFYVPDYFIADQSKVGAGSGVFGSTVSERGLTYVGVDVAGHEIPQYAPSAAYRIVEFLLGRAACLDCPEGYETEPKDMGNGTAPYGWSRRG
ncbi:hypothetical protein QBC44DRAFT_284776 [Cladorrhinum sp. PSN332]|nr:hypothetical protein QBC44DRAFT_284776 [Cladorrhinum sp. PSN332]